MTEQNARGQRPTSRILLACGMALGVAFLILVGVGALLLFRARPSGEILRARINSPVADQQVEVNQPLGVMAVVADLAGTSRVEVYADGTLILAQDSTGQGQTELSLIGRWIPLTTGRHVLMARGHGPGDVQADSNVVYVDVRPAPQSVVIDVDRLKTEAGAPNPSLNVLAQQLGTTPDELRRRNPALAGISSSDPIPPGTRVEAPNPPQPAGTLPTPIAPNPTQPPGAVPTPIAPYPSQPPGALPTQVAPIVGAPSAPTGVSGTADCVSAVLTWSRSPDAASYRVYRLDPSETSVRRIAAGLEAKATSYRDELPAPGGYSYQIASVSHTGQETRSSMFTVASPHNCPGRWHAPGTADNLWLRLASVRTDGAYEGIFCYLQINEGRRDRFPEGDFTFFPPVDAQPGYWYNLTSLPGGGWFNLIGQPLTSPVALDGECLGRHGPDAQSIGTFRVREPQEHWDGTLRTAHGIVYDETGTALGEGFRFTYCLGPSTAPCMPPIPGFPTEPEYTNEYNVNVDLAPEQAVTVYLPAPTNVRRSESTEGCLDLPLNDQIDCLQYMVPCLVGYCPRSTIFWDWENSSPWNVHPTSYTVVRTSHDLSTGAVSESSSWDVNPRSDGTLPQRLLSPDSDLRCGQTVEYRVRANMGALQSALSDPATFRTPLCPAAADVTVIFQTLTVEGTVDDTGDDQNPYDRRNVRDHLEVQGELFANGGTGSSSHITTGGDLLTGWSLGAGTYNFAALDMLDHGLNYNVIRTRISDERETLTVGVSLDEHDVSWDRHVTFTPWCVVSEMLPARSVLQWSAMNIDRYLVGGNEEAGCRVWVSIIGHPGVVIVGSP